MKVSSVHRVDQSWFGLPFSSPIQLASSDDYRYLEISRTGNFDSEYHLSWNLNLLSH